MSKNGRVVSKNFGSMLKYARENKNLSLKELKDKTGISEAYINRLENSERKAPSIPIATQLANALDLDLAMMLDACNSKSDDVKSIAELLLTSDFTINGSIIAKEAKEILISIIEKIVSAEWNENKMKEAYEISSLIDAYKRAL